MDRLRRFRRASWNGRRRHVGAGKVSTGPATRTLTGLTDRPNDAAMSKKTEPTKTDRGPTDSTAEVGAVWHGFLPDDDPRYRSAAPAPQKKVGATFRGSLPDDDPRYRGGGWNFLMGKNLAPKSDKAGDE